MMKSKVKVEKGKVKASSPSMQMQTTAENGKEARKQNKSLKSGMKPKLKKGCC